MHDPTQNDVFEASMTKRKPVKTSKRAASSKSSKAQRRVAKSPKNSRPPAVVSGSSTETPPKHPGDSCQAAGVIDSRQVASPVEENPATSIQQECQPTTTDKDEKKGFDFSWATANAWAYQAKLHEAALADINLAFESAQRLATTSSPAELPRIIADFASKRIAMYMEIFKSNS
jgi:hypothetical protein